MLIFGGSGSPWQLPVATAGHNRLTLAQQGGFAASLVSFPYPVLKLVKNRRTGASLVLACLLALLRRITLPSGNPV